MSRDERPRLPDEEPDDGEIRGNLRTTAPGTLAAVFIAGLVIGRLIRPVSVWLDGTAPRVGWLPILLLFFVAAVIAGVAWSTWRTLQHGRGRLPAHQAVNRLVLAKACALAGSVVAGGYLGYALSWINDEAQLAGERLGHSCLAALASALLVAGSLALERACRVGNGKNQS